MGNMVEQLGRVRREGSPAFNLNYDHDPTITEFELRKDIVSYLCEYRLREKKHSYTLAFSNARLCDVRRFEPMAQKAARAIKERKKVNEPTEREEAELQGILNLEDQLRFASPGDMIAWASPPGPKEQGYGDYGFFFIGSITPNGQILMTANRVEHPSLEQFNTAFNGLTGVNVNYRTAEEFLANPMVIRGFNLNLKSADQVLFQTFDFKEDQREKERIGRILKRMEPLIDDFARVLRHGTRQEKTDAFNTLENYALELKARYESLDSKVVCIDDYKAVRLFDLISTYKYEAPVVGGSCGGTAKKKSNDPLSNGLDFLNKFLEEDEGFVCPKCNYKADGPVGNRCPNCGLTKEQYEKEGNETC